jgi:hypothetical protein
MSTLRQLSKFAIIAAIALTGCAAKTVDMSKIHRPDRPSELDAYNTFVGSWTWQAEMMNADQAHRNWTGTAEWSWALDNRALHGHLTSTSGDVSFESAGLWSVSPGSKKYVWWMFNNWGYMQHGKATYNAGCKTWTMPFKSTGLDGTASEGEYVITVVDNNTLRWELHEWASMHMAKKIEMKGTYTRKS